MPRVGWRGHRLLAHLTLVHVARRLVKIWHRNCLQKKVGKFIVLEQLLHPLHKNGIPFIFGKKIFLQNHFATLNNG